MSFKSDVRDLAVVCLSFAAATPLFIGAALGAVTLVDAGIRQGLSPLSASLVVLASCGITLGLVGGIAWLVSRPTPPAKEPG